MSIAAMYIFAALLKQTFFMVVEQKKNNPYNADDTISHKISILSVLVTVNKRQFENKVI